MKKLFTLLLTLLLLAQPAGALGETVVTSFFPIYVFALNLTDGIDGLEIASLTAPDAGCLHDYQLQTGDMKLLARANVFLINGAGMEGYLAGVFEAYPELPVVDASHGVTLLESCEDGHGHDHDHDHDHGHEVNAHIWLDAENAIAMVENLAEGLIVQLPQHAQAISDNRDAYVARLRALDEELTEGLTGLARHDIITFHEAFPYFAEAYGLHVAAVLNHEPDDALSPRALAELCEEVAHHGTPPLFVEPQYEDIAAQIVARETGAEIHVLDPVVTGPEGEITLRYYEDVMRANMAVLQAVLGQ